MIYDRQLITNGNPMEEIVGFSRAVRVGPYIAVGGTAPVDANGKTVGVGDVYAQTTRCFEIIETALQAAGSGLHDIIRIDIERCKSEPHDIRRAEIADQPPRDTGLHCRIAVFESKTNLTAPLLRIARACQRQHGAGGLYPCDELLGEGD